MSNDKDRGDAPDEYEYVKDEGVETDHESDGEVDGDSDGDDSESWELELGDEENAGDEGDLEEDSDDERSVPDQVDDETLDAVQEESLDQPADSLPNAGSAQLGSDESFVDPIAESRQRFSGKPDGVRRGDSHGLELVDMLAGRVCSFGFGFDPVLNAIAAATEDHTADASQDSFRDQERFGVARNEMATESMADAELLESFNAVMRSADPSTPIQFNAVWAAATADEAFEHAISIARHIAIMNSGNSSKYKTVSLIGSDHGRTALCRAASGQVELQEGFGPLMAGFQHCAANEPALVKCIDESTAAVVVTPVDLTAGGGMVDAGLVRSVRQQCDNVGALLIIDESRLGFASSGSPLAISQFDGVVPDAVLVSAGLFGGLAGGMIFATERLADAYCNAFQGASEMNALNNAGDFPLATAAAKATLAELMMVDFVQLSESMQAYAVLIAERIGGFEFIRDLSVSGLIIGIETDLASEQIVAAARRRGLRLASAGETSLRMQLPAVMQEGDMTLVVEKLGDVFECVERVSATQTV